MKLTKLTLVTGLVLTTFVRAHGTEIIADNYDVPNNGSGFLLDEGLNAGINPPATRLTGSAAPNLRYIKAFGDKNDSAHSVNAQGKFRVNRTSSGSSTVTFSDGAGAYDFGAALNTLSLSPTNRAEYDLTITFANNANGNQRCSFALSSAAGTANAWDFGLQLYRPNSTDPNYTIMRRVSAASGDLGGPLNANPISTTNGIYGEEISFLIRVTDAGAEAVASTNSFIEVAVVDAGVTNWIYDTRTDTSLPTGWRFAGPSRFIYFDVANNAGAVTYDNFSLNHRSGPLAGTRTWTGGGSDDNWSNGLNWGGSAPNIGDTLVFDGIARQVNFNDITGLIVPKVQFNNGGFSLSGNQFSIAGDITNLAGINTFNGELGFASTAVKTWGIASGSEITLNNVSTVEVGGDHTILGGGTLRLKGAMNIGQLTTASPAFVVNEGQHIVDGGMFISRGGYRIGSLATGIGAQTILTNGATFTLTLAAGNLRVGDSANPAASRLVIDNSTLTMTGGALGIPYSADSIGEVAQVGGTFGGGVIAFSDAGAGTGTYTIRDGTVEPLQIREDTAGGASAIYFDNAVLRPAVGAASPFFAGVDIAEIQAGGLTIDAQYDVAIDQVLSGPGSLTKSGFATVTLNGANTYLGNTIVQSGRLVYPNTLTNTATIQVADGAELGVVVTNAGGTLSLGTVTLGGGSFSALNIDLGSFGKPTAPLMKVSSLTANGTVTVNVANGLQLSTGQFVLVDYDGAIGGGFNFTLGSLPHGVIATMVNNVGNSSIDLNITGVPGLRWTGAVNGEWDYGTQNWIDLQTAAPSFYADQYPLEFPDSAANGIINISAFPLPALIAVNNDTLPYVWSGGAITTPLLNKSGTNSLTRNEGAPDLIDVIELNEGSYIANDSGDTVLASVLSDTSAGEGTFVKQGASTLTLTGTNDTYDGAIVVQQGMLKMGTGFALGTTNGGTTIASGATLDVNNFVAPHEPVIVSGEGYTPFGASSPVGAIIDSTAATGVANNLTDVTMVGDTTFGSPNGRWDIRMRSGTGHAPGLRGNGFNLTKVGPGALSIAAQRHFGNNTPYWEMNLGDIFVKEGSLTFAESLSLGNPSKTITISPGATLSTYDLRNTNPIVRNIFMTDATITGGGGEGDTNVFSGVINMTGANHLRPINTILIIDGSLQGTGSLNVSASGVGALQLNGINTYPGDTIVTNGTFGGNGLLAGNLVMLDGTLAPGTGIGTFTVNGNATLAGATVIELDRSQSPNSDRVVVGGNLNLGGALTVVLGAGAPSPQAGDVYQLFNKGGAGTFAPINLPNLAALPGDLAWDISKLTVDGTITVTGAATPPTIGSVSFDGGNLVFSGTGGIEGGTYVVLTSPNVAEPIENWIPIATNVFGAGGSFSYTNSVNPATPESFYLLQVP